MKYIAFLIAALIAMPSFAADCDSVTFNVTDRNGQGWSVRRVLIADGKTGTGASTKCTPPSRVQTDFFGRQHLIPWDFYRFFAEQGDTCTSWTATIRDYPVNSDTTQCRGACDSHTLATFDSTATTSRSFSEPLGEAMDANVTAITCSGGLSVYADFYYRDLGK